MIVLDASVLIAHVEPADAYHAAALDLLTSVADEGLAVSPVTLAEFYVGPARGGVLDRAELVVRQLALEVIPLAADAPRRLALLRAQTRLKLPECCVLLAAEQVDGEVASFDRMLREQTAACGLRVRV